MRGTNSLPLAICALLICSMPNAAFDRADPFTASNTAPLDSDSFVRCDPSPTISRDSTAQPFVFSEPESDGEPDEYEPNDSPENATDLTYLLPSLRIRPTLHHMEDIDYFRFQLDVSCGLRISSSGFGCPPDGVLTLYDGGLTVIHQVNTSEGDIGWVAFSILVHPGSYFLSVHTNDTGPIQAYQLYIIQYPCVSDEFENDNSFEQARNDSFYNFYQTVNGISSHQASDEDHTLYPEADIDFYKFHTPVPSYYFLYSYNSFGVDCQVRVFDEEGQVVYQAVESDTTCPSLTRETWMPLTVGTYRISVQCVDPSAIVPYYRLTLYNWEVIPDAYENDGNREHAKRIEFGEVQDHNLCSGSDTDWVFFTLERTASIHLSCRADTTQTEPNIALLVYEDNNTSGAWDILCDEDEGPNEDWVAYFLAPMDYYVVVLIIDLDKKQIPQYNLSLDYLHSIEIKHPCYSDLWNRGETHEIVWESCDSSGNVSISLLYQEAPLLNITDSTADTGSFMWSVPEFMLEMGNYQIVIRSLSKPSLSYCISEPFYITSANIDSGALANFAEDMKSFFEHHGTTIAGVLGILGLGVATAIIIRRRTPS